VAVVPLVRGEWLEGEKEKEEKEEEEEEEAHAGAVWRMQ
jgi:hypothetical protein